MASAVYSTRFIGQEFSTSYAEYTAPVGYVTIIRDIDVVNNGATPGFFVFLSNLTENYAIWLAKFSDSQQTLSWRGRQVIAAGETIALGQSGTSTLQGCVSGYLLTLP